MSVLRLWPLLAFMFVPGVFAWWSGRRLVRERDDPTLAERFLARAEHAQRVTLLSAACLAFAAGSYYWFAVLGLVLGHWIGDYPSRRVVLDERWAPATYVLWHLRFHLAWLGFWFALLVAPTVIQASGVWRWPVAGTLAVLLGLWAWRYTEAFVWLVRARPRPWRTEWQPIVDRARATRPRLFDMPVPGGRFVNAFAFPSTRVPSVLFTDPALELRAGARLVAPEPRPPAARDSPRGPDPGHAVRRHAGRRDHAPDVAGRPRPRRGVVGGGARSGGAGSRDSAPDGQVEVVGAVRRAGRAAGARLLVGRRRVAGGARQERIVARGADRPHRGGGAPTKARRRRASARPRHARDRAAGGGRTLHRDGPRGRRRLRGGLAVTGADHRARRDHPPEPRRPRGRRRSRRRVPARLRRRR